MRVEFLPGGPASGSPSAAPRPARRRLDRFEICLLAVFAALSMWVVALDLWQMIDKGLVWTGTDGFFIVDQMQYLAWIQAASHHLLVSNLFVLRATPSDYFQPAVLISGAISALGVAPWLTLLLWKPIAVVATFLATRAYAYRSLEGHTARRVGLILGLLFGSFSVVNGAFGIVGDMMPTWLSWGYPFGLLGVALIVVALLGYDRARTAGRVAWMPGLCGALAGALHPWQGEVMVLILVAAEAIRWRDHRSLRSLRLAGAHAGADRPAADLLRRPGPRRHLLGAGQRGEQALVLVLVDRDRRRAAGRRRRARLPRAPARLPGADDAPVAAGRGNDLLHLGHGAECHPAARLRRDHDPARRCWPWPACSEPG